MIMTWYDVHDIQRYISKFCPKFETLKNFDAMKKILVQVFMKSPN